MSLRSRAAEALRCLPPSAGRWVSDAVLVDVRQKLGDFAPGDVGFVARPPDAAPGTTTGAPDFVVLAATDDAGRWWSALVSRRDDVVVADGDPVTRFFAPFGCRTFGEAEVARFERFFPRRSGERSGYWCPDGLVHPWVAPCLATAAPEARLVVVLCDPVEALLAELEVTSAKRAPHVGSVLAAAFDRGCYGTQLRRVRDHFDEDHLLVLQLERCIAEPRDELARTVSFLGLDGAELPTVARQPPVPGRGAALDGATRERLRRLYAPQLDALVEIVPDVDLTWWPGATA